jgi:hypothetical protein
MSKTGENLGYVSIINSMDKKNCSEYSTYTLLLTAASALISHLNCFLFSECAIDQNEYKKTGLIGKMFNCDELGNYASKQCTGSVCYCVDSLGKKIEGTSTHISKYNLLSCRESRCR